MLKNILRKLIDPHRHWDRKLPEAAFAISVSWQKSPRYSPFQLMHGYVPRVPGQILLNDVEEDLNEVSRIAQLAKKREQAKENLEQSQRAAKSRYDAKRKEPNFQLVDTVYCTLGSRSSTLDPSCEGPFEVMELLGGNTVKIARIQNRRHRKKERVVNVEQLRIHLVQNASFPEHGESFIGQQLRLPSEDGAQNQEIEPQQETRGVNNRCDNLNDGNSHAILNDEGQPGFQGTPTAPVVAVYPPAVSPAPTVIVSQPGKGPQPGFPPYNSSLWINNACKYYGLICMPLESCSRKLRLPLTGCGDHTVCCNIKKTKDCSKVGGQCRWRCKKREIPYHYAKCMARLGKCCIYVQKKKA
ncbi:hypothetical protein MTO96_050709 [Rhipicephalus appendiculatus]